MPSDQPTMENQQVPSGSQEALGVSAGIKPDRTGLLQQQQDSMDDFQWAMPEGMKMDDSYNTLKDAVQRTKSAPQKAFAPGHKEVKDRSKSVSFSGHQVAAEGKKIFPRTPTPYWGSPAGSKDELEFPDYLDEHGRVVSGNLLKPGAAGQEKRKK